MVAHFFHRALSIAQFCFSAASAWLSATPARIFTATALSSITAWHQAQAHAWSEYLSSSSFFAPHILSTTFCMILFLSLWLKSVELRIRLLTSLAVRAAILHVQAFQAGPVCFSATSPMADSHRNSVVVVLLGLALGSSACSSARALWYQSVIAASLQSVAVTSSYPGGFCAGPNGSTP